MPYSRLLIIIIIMQRLCVGHKDDESQATYTGDDTDENESN